MNQALARQALRVTRRTSKFLFGLVGVSVSFNHILNPGTSLLGTGLPVLGFQSFSLPPMPAFVAVLAGVLIAAPAIGVLVSSIFGRQAYRQAMKNVMG